MVRVRVRVMVSITHNHYSNSNTAESDKKFNACRHLTNSLLSPHIIEAMLVIGVGLELAPPLLLLSLKSLL